MKKILLILLFLCPLWVAAQKTPSSVVAEYIKILNKYCENGYRDEEVFDDIMTPIINNVSYSCEVQTELSDKMRNLCGKYGISCSDPTVYAGRIDYRLYVNCFFKLKIRRVDIVGSMKEKKEYGSTIVTATIKYSGGILNGFTTVNDYRIESNAIFSIYANQIAIDSLVTTPSLPFSITDCTVVNEDNNGNPLPFDAAHTQYLTPTITYNCTTPGSYEIYVKLYNSSGNLSTGSSSPSGYSQVSGQSLSSGSRTIKLKGWGGNDSGHWRAGSYRYEFYYNGTLLYTHPFTVPEGTPTSIVTSGSSGSHQYVDLGLPSRTLWATCNVGANNEWEYGDYFAWGETIPYYSSGGNTKKPVWKSGKGNGYSWSSYKYANGNYDKLTKYCNTKYCGNNGFTDSRTILESSDDAATANWGSDWCMPTFDQINELKEKCKWTWTTKNGIKGYKVTGPNGNSLFLPAAGYRYGTALGDVGSGGDYWSRSLNESDSNVARFLGFISSRVDWFYDYRYHGRTVRPVRCK